VSEQLAHKIPPDLFYSFSKRYTCPARVTIFPVMAGPRHGSDNAQAHPVAQAGFLDNLFLDLDGFELNRHAIKPVILRCERSEPRRMSGPTVSFEARKSAHLRMTGMGLSVRHDLISFCYKIARTSVTLKNSGRRATGVLNS
jgi:hypothetical protein